jgi:hypothetical protein
MFNPRGVAGKLLRGWEVAGVVTLQSGLPLAVTQVTNFNAFAGFGTQRPNRIADPNLPSSQQTTVRWFDTSAFTVAPQFTLGNSLRNPVRCPGYRNADVAFIKRPYFGEGLRGKSLALFLIVDATDSYRAVFALPELDHAFTERVVLLADRRDGKALSAAEGPLRIVVPDEKRQARWVRQVTALNVRRAE